MQPIDPKEVRREFIQELANEFLSDPNCFPETWIDCENVTDKEKSLFYQLISEI